MKAIVKDKFVLLLCGGRGSRMGDYTTSIPKPLLNVHGKPILWYTFWTLYNQGFRNYILPLGYQGGKIKKYVSKISEGLDCKILFKNTGVDTSIAERINLVKDMIPENSDFFMLNSDTLFDFDIKEMYLTHLTNKALVTLSSVEVVSSWGLMFLKDDKLVGFDRERKVRHFVSNDFSDNIYGLVYSGFVWINKSALEHVDLIKCQDFEQSLYQRIIEISKSANYQIQGLWYPIDTPKDLKVVNLNIHDKHNTGNSAKEFKEKLALLETNHNAIT